MDRRFTLFAPHPTCRPLTAAMFCLISGLASTALVAGPPESPRRPIEQVFHGQTVVDPYRWLEGGPAGEMTDEVAAWTDAQNAYTLERLRSLPGREAVQAMLLPLLQQDAQSLPKRRGRYRFFTHRTGTQDHDILMVVHAQEPEARPRPLIDPKAIDPSGLTSLDWTSPSPDGTLLAFGLSRSGDENSTLHLLDVATGQWLADEIPNRAGSVQWLPDGRQFVYEHLEDPENPYSAQIRLHTVGRHRRTNPLLFEQLKEGPLATTWGPGATLSDDGQWLLLHYWTSTSSNDLWLVDFARYLRTGQFDRITLAEGLPAQFWGSFVGDQLLLYTTHDAPRGMLYRVDPHRPQRANWRVFAPEHPESVLSGYHRARGYVLLAYKQLLADRFVIREMHGERSWELPLPGRGSASLATEAELTDIYISYEAPDTPETHFRMTLPDGPLEPVWKRNVPLDTSFLLSEMVWITSQDGTRVPMTLLRRRDAKPDGQNPALLTAYGGFGISNDLSFSATLALWVQMGGIFAEPAIRGGGEFGETWHEQGRAANKQNSFNDFLAAARWLVDQKWTSPAHLAISGGSNGGLLVGAALTQQPDLFSAVICDVPLLDMLRYQDFLMARYWVPEYGSAEDDEQFKFLREYSPYHAVRPATAYPAVLLMAGENDTRVHPLHARKMAATLQHATTADPERKPILLLVNRDAGHGSGMPMSMIIEELTNRRMFIMWQTGMLERWLAGQTPVPPPPPPAAATTLPALPASPIGE